MLVMGKWGMFLLVSQNLCGFFSCVLSVLSPNMSIIADVSRQLEIHYRPRWGESRHASFYTDVHH